MTQTVPETVPTICSTKKVIEQPDLEIHEVINVDDISDSINANEVVQPSAKVRKNHSMDDVIGDLQSGV